MTQRCILVVKEDYREVASCLYIGSMSLSDYSRMRSGNATPEYAGFSGFSFPHCRPIFLDELPKHR
jgi:hypothetical protein